MKTTNAMRILEAHGIPFGVAEYPVDENDLSGVHIAETLGIDPERMFKTLVVRGDKNGIAVFCLPCAMELDLKKCAVLTGDKSVEMVAVKELLGLTGYIRGGCSPVGMKKSYPTFMDETATLWEEIYVSAGVRGAQLIVDPLRLAEFASIKFADITK